MSHSQSFGLLLQGRQGRAESGGSEEAAGGCPQARQGCLHSGGAKLWHGPQPQLCARAGPAFGGEQGGPALDEATGGRRVWGR